MPSSHPLPTSCHWFSRLASALDPRSAPRLAWLLVLVGVLVLTVPAHAFLFDEMDRLAHHRRRYARAELRAKLEAAGYEVRSLFHFMASLVPLLLVTRTVGRALPWAQAARRRDLEMSVVPIVNPALAALLSVERWALRRGWSFPFGTSLLAVAVRPGAGGPRSAGRDGAGSSPAPWPRPAPRSLRSWV